MLNLVLISIRIGTKAKVLFRFEHIDRVNLKCIGGFYWAKIVNNLFT